MSYIRTGTCSKCGKYFYVSIGHPFMMRGWETSLYKKWYYSFPPDVCQYCAPPRPVSFLKKDGNGKFVLKQVGEDEDNN